MTKTCGTCGCVNGRFCLCITNMTALGCEVCLRPEETEACDKWIERTDSLEQVALDALTFATCLLNTGCALDSEFADYKAEYAGEQSRFIYIDTSLRLRLRALGVEVSQ